MRPSCLANPIRGPPSISDNPSRTAELPTPSFLSKRFLPHSMPIVETPDVMGGRPRIAGHRIDVTQILGHLKRGETVKSIADKVFPSLEFEEVEDAVEWLYDNTDRVRELRIRELLAHEHSRRTASKPPIEIYKSCEFVSTGPEANDIRDIVLMPSRRFVRVMFDASYESYTVYDIDLVDEIATPVVDEPGWTRGDAIARADEYAHAESLPIGDRIYRKGSVKLGKIPER